MDMPRVKNIIAAIATEYSITLTEADMTALSEDPTLCALLDTCVNHLKVRSETQATLIRASEDAQWDTPDTPQSVLQDTRDAIKVEACESEQESPAVDGSSLQQPDATTAHDAAQASIAVAGDGRDGAPENNVMRDETAQEITDPVISDTVTNEACDDAQSGYIDPGPVQSQPGQDKQWQPMAFDPLVQNKPEAEAPLLTGQIPGGDKVQDKPALAAVQARINVPNARAGTPYHTQPEITLSSGEHAELHSISFSQDIGLIFDPASKTLSGIPTRSGDIGMLVTWSSASHATQATRLLFIVNPDPRSLWKVIEPPADDRYYKSNIDNKTLVAADGAIIAASRRGRSHEHAGTFRDDDFYINHSSDTRWRVMLVADGAGSAKNSRQGSRMVSETVGNYLYEQLSGTTGQELAARINHWTTDDQKYVFTTFHRQFQHASMLAIQAINHEAAAQEQPVKSYATTLLAAVSFREGDNLFAAAFWLGDGAIAAYGPVGKVRVLGEPDSGEYAGQTRFLDSEAILAPDFGNRIRIGKWNDVTHVLLMTDGVSDPCFETDNGLKNPEKWDALLAELQPCIDSAAPSSQALAEWLNFFSPGNHDDRTLIVSW